VVDVLTKPRIGEKEEARRAAAERGLTDLYFFNKVILNNPVLYEPLHRPICQWLERTETTSIPFGKISLTTGKRKKLFLMPRGHVKSNIGTIGHTCQEIARDQNLRTLVGAHKTLDARKFTRAIRRYLESKRFRYFYPHVRPALSRYTRRPLLWSDEALLVERGMDLVEATVENASTDAMVTGRHYDRFKFDDIVTQKSITVSALAAVKEFHEYADGLADPGCIELLTGTRYDFADRYGDILETPDLRDQYDVVQLTAFQEQNDDPDTDYSIEWLMEHGTPIFPTRFTTSEAGGLEDTDKVISLRKLWRKGAKFFNTQYMNRPQDPTTQVFTDKLLERIWVDRLPAGVHAYFRVCDLSGENQTRESYTAIVTGCVDENSCIYITDIIRGNYSASWILDELFRGQEVPEDARPKLIGFEPSMFEKVLKNIMWRMGVSRGTHIPVKMLPVGLARRSKADRIRGLESWLANGLFKVLRSCRNAQILRSELYRHPATTAVDVADACAMIPIFMFPGRSLEAAPDTYVVDDNIRFGPVEDRYLGNRRVMRQGSSMIALPRAL